MEISKRYNSVHVKDNCAPFAPTPFFGPCYPIVSFKFLLCQSLLPWRRILRQPLWKILARCFHLLPYFRARAIWWYHLNFSPEDPCCHGSEFLGQKLTITWPPWKINARRLHLRSYFWARAIRWCHLNFSPADPCCHGNEFWDKIDYNSVPWKIIVPCLHLLPLYTPARLYNMAMGQIPHSTDRIFSIDIKCCCLQSATGVYLAALPPPPVPQILCKVCWHFFYSSILFIRLPGSIVREGLMFCNSFYYYFFNARSPRSVGWLPRNFATWRKACSIL